MIKDLYRRLANEWGRKARKEESRSAKSTLKKPTREELADQAMAEIEAEVEALPGPWCSCSDCRKQWPR